MKLLQLLLLLFITSQASAQFNIPIPESVQKKFNTIEEMQERIRSGVKKSGTELKKGGVLIGSGVALNIIGSILIAASPARIRMVNGEPRTSISGGQAAGIALNGCGLGLDVGGVYYLFKSGNTMKKTFEVNL